MLWWRGHLGRVARDVGKMPASTPTHSIENYCWLQATPYDQLRFTGCTGMSLIICRESSGGYGTLLPLIHLAIHLSSDSCSSAYMGSEHISRAACSEQGKSFTL